MVPELGWYFRHLRSPSLRFPGGRNEPTSQGCRAQWQTLWRVAALPRALQKLGWPLSKMVWFLLTEQHLLPRGVGKEGRWFVLGPMALVEGRWVLGLFSSPSSERSEFSILWGQHKAGGWASLPSSFTLGCRQIKSHNLGLMEVVGFHTCYLSRLRWQLGTLKGIGFRTFLCFSPRYGKNLDE